jgi:fumarylpyruvate hydrolase
VGSYITEADALTHVFGYAVGLDLTRRDLQAIAKAKGMPWDTAKAFDHSAPLSAIRAAAEIGHPQHAALTLEVNGQLRQQSDIAQMIFSVPEILARLSRLFELKAGDLVFTGTPAGVGPLMRGDAVQARLAGVAELRCRIA